MQNGKKDQDRKLKRKYLKNQKVNPGSPTPDQQAGIPKRTETARGGNY